MPTPVAFDGSGVDPFFLAREADRTTTSHVFIATDREPAERSDDAPVYSNARSRLLRIAVAEVDLARGMTWPQLHEQSLRARRAKQPAIRLVGTRELGAIWEDVPPLGEAPALNEAILRSFGDQVQAKLDRSNPSDVFVFVHGFNTRFDGNTMLAAELHHYLGRQGVFISYAWPSQHSLFAYDEDKANARYSTRYFRLFLQFLAARTDARRIHIIAHSAGAPIAVEAVRQIRLLHADDETDAIRRRYRLGNLVLVAPDMDVAHFYNANFDGTHKVPERVAVYISTHDRALSFSAWMHGFARLGNPVDVLTPEALERLRHMPSLEVIDVATAEHKYGSFLGHSYFHNDPWVSSDLIMLLRHDLPPAGRGLATTADSPIWTFPADYPARVRASAREAYGVANGEPVDCPK